jgi:hypothetical protein
MIQRRMDKIKILKIEPIGGGDHMIDQNVIILCPNMMQANWAWREFQKRYHSIIEKAVRNPLRVHLYNGNTVYFESEQLGVRPDLWRRAKIMSMEQFENGEVSDG